MLADMCVFELASERVLPRVRVAFPLFVFRLVFGTTRS
jgi:hypothetical protein